MTEQKVPNQRDIKTESGNYSERIGKHYIQAKQVYITEHYEHKETNATPDKAKCKIDINRKGKATFVLTGTIDSVDKKLLRALEIHLQKFSEDASLTIIDIESGSIKLTLEASYEGLERLRKLIEEGKLTEVLGIPVEYIELSNDENLNSKDVELNYKSRLIQDILSQGARGNYLGGVNLSDADLTGADLCSSNLSNANLVKAKLSHTNLVRANLTGADLNSADLTGSNLSLAHLDGVNLINGNLTNTCLSHAYLKNANLTNTNLTKADLSDANLKNANLSSANFNFSNLSRADLSGCNLVNTNLENANLSRADLSHADLSGANLTYANLGHGNLSLTIIDETTKIDDKWRKVWEIVQGCGIKHLNNIDLSYANLNYADLSNANLQGADLSGAFLVHTNLSYSILIDANLSNANLKNANIIGTDFSGANVSNAQFGKNLGISEPIKQELIRRGAIFEDSPGDRSGVLVSC